MSVLGNAKSNRHRKTSPVEPGGTGRKYMILHGEIWSARAVQKSAEAIVALMPGESREERRAEESRNNLANGLWGMNTPAELQGGIRWA